MSKKNLLLIFSFFPLALPAQSQKQDTLFIAIALKNAISVYELQFPNPVFLYTGGEYLEYDHHIDGFPFFIEDNFTSGAVILNGQKFNDIQLCYDIHKDKLVVEHYNQYNHYETLELITEKVDSFSIHGYKFFNIKEKTHYNSQLPLGFYNLLYDGDVKVFSKKHKIFSETIIDRAIKREFYLQEKYYIVNDGQVYSVKNKRSMLAAFNDKKKELKKRLKMDQVNFVTNFEKALIKVSEIYDELKSDQ